MSGSIRARLAVVFALFAVMLGVPGLAAANGGGANVVKGQSCVINLDALEPGATVVTTDMHSVVTPSGNVALKCTGDIPDDLVPPKAVRVRGEQCFVYGGCTYNTMVVFTPSGKAHLTCLVNGSD
jgi:hypothetical protein